MSAGCAQPVVRLLEPHDHARWDAFVDACPAATFFHRAGWQTVIERVFGHRTWFFFVEHDGRVLGVLPLAQVKSRLFGHALVSLPFCVQGGVAASSELAACLLDAAADQLARQLKVGHLEYRHLAPAHSHDPAWRQKALYVNFQKTLFPDDESNLRAIPRKQRAMVRKGIGLGLSAAPDEDTERLFACYAVNVHRLGTPVFPKRYFAMLKEVFGDACEVRVVMRGRDLVAAVMSFYFRDQVLPYYAGAMPAARALAANDFMYWNLMQAAAARGVRVFDMGRSKIGTGAYDFKVNWGFLPTPLAYSYRLYRARSLPEHNPLNPRYRLLIQAWKRLPLRLANLLGPLVVRNLG
jgi:FemAB-related protein (PEP-CTERM system-associated)